LSSILSLGSEQVRNVRLDELERGDWIAELRASPVYFEERGRVGGGSESRIGWRVELGVWGGGIAVRVGFPFHLL